MIRRLFVLGLAMAGCGGGGDPPAVDSPVSNPTIVRVDPCPATPDASFMTLSSRFEPTSATITQGQVVQFISESTHPIGPTGGTEATLTVPEGATRCFQFTAPGTYMFKCTVHGFVGTLTVN